MHKKKSKLKWTKKPKVLGWYWWRSGPGDDWPIPTKILSRELGEGSFGQYYGPIKEPK